MRKIILLMALLLVPLVYADLHQEIIYPVEGQTNFSNKVNVLGYGTPIDIYMVGEGNIGEPVVAVNRVQQFAFEVDTTCDVDKMEVIWKGYGTAYMYMWSQWDLYWKNLGRVSNQVTKEFYFSEDYLRDDKLYLKFYFSSSTGGTKRIYLRVTYDCNFIPEAPKVYTVEELLLDGYERVEFLRGYNNPKCGSPNPGMNYFDEFTFIPHTGYGADEFLFDLGDREVEDMFLVWDGNMAIAWYHPIRPTRIGCTSHQICQYYPTLNNPTFANTWQLPGTPCHIDIVDLFKDDNNTMYIRMNNFAEKLFTEDIFLLVKYSEPLVVEPLVTTQECPVCETCEMCEETTCETCSELDTSELESKLDRLIEILTAIFGGVI